MSAPRELQTCIAIVILSQAPRGQSDGSLKSNVPRSRLANPYPTGSTGGLLRESAPARYQSGVCLVRLRAAERGFKRGLRFHVQKVHFRTLAFPSF